MRCAPAPALLLAFKLLLCACELSVLRFLLSLLDLCAIILSKFPNQKKSQVWC